MRQGCTNFVCVPIPCGRKKCLGDTCKYCLDPNNRIYCDFMFPTYAHAMLNFVEKNRWTVVYVKGFFMYRAFCPSCTKNFTI